jgi:hypothetical protein
MHTDQAPKTGPLLWRRDLGIRDVLLSPRNRSTIGRASSVGRTVGGIALWRLTVRGAKLTGEWIVLGQESLPVEERRRERRVKPEP